MIDDGTQQSSTKQLLELAMGAFAQAAFAQVAPVLGLLPAFSASLVSDKPQTPRIVAFASFQGESEDVRISGTYAELWNVLLSIEIPPSDKTAQLIVYEQAVVALAREMVSPSEIVLAQASSCADVGAFDLLIVTGSQGVEPQVDNDRIEYQASFAVVAHRTFSS